MKRQTFFVILFLIFPSIGQTETVYVTDLLRLRLFEQSGSQGQVIKTVSSGDALEILERQPGYAKVRGTDGTIGWAKSTYLVTDKPPRLIVNNLQQQMKRMQKNLHAANKKLQTAIDDSKKHKQVIDDHNNKTKKQQALVDKLRRQNIEFEKSMQSYESSVPMNIFFLSIIFFFIIGISLGWYIIDYKIRKRHGGFRLY